MRTNTIIDKVGRTLERSIFGKIIGSTENDPLPFVYADNDIQNIVLDRVQPPFSAAVPITSGMILDERGQYHDRVTLAVFFGDGMKQGMPDYDAKENERIIDECKQRAFMWLASLQGNTEIELVSVNASDRWYLEKDAILTGYVVNVTIEEVRGYGKCELKAAEQG